MPEIIIDDSNWRQHIGEDGILPADHEYANGEARMMGCLPRVMPVGAVPYCATGVPLIPRSEWIDRIKRQDDEQSSLRHIADAIDIPCYDQGSTYFCHANATVGAGMLLRAANGQPMRILSPGSVAGPVTNYRNVGAYIESDLQVMAELGAATIDYVPANQISRAGWKGGAEQNALLHRFSEWYDLGAKDGDMWQKVVSLLLLNIPVVVAYNWWGHAVLAVRPVLDGSTVGLMDRNSWGKSYGDNGYFKLFGERAIPDYAFAPRTILANLN